MGTTTPRFGLHKPDDADLARDFPSGLRPDMDVIDSALGFFPCTSGTRPASPVNGRTIRETDTGKSYLYDGTGWKQVYTEGGGNVPIAVGQIGAAEINDNLNDPAVTTAGLRTLGTGALQASPGNHLHDSRYPQGLISWFQKTANSTPSTGPANIQRVIYTFNSVIAGHLYRVSCPGLGVFGSVNDARAELKIRYTTNNTIPTSSSTQLIQASVPLTGAGNVESLDVVGFYLAPSSFSGFVPGLFLARVGASGDVTCFGTSGWPITIMVEDLGVAPTQQGG